MECKQYEFDTKLLLYNHLENRHSKYDLSHKIIEMIAEKQPKPIGPTEADNWEYNGERWVKKEK